MQSSSVGIVFLSPVVGSHTEKQKGLDKLASDCPPVAHRFQSTAASRLLPAPEISRQALMNSAWRQNSTGPAARGGLPVQRTWFPANRVPMTSPTRIAPFDHHQDQLETHTCQLDKGGEKQPRPELSQAAGPPVDGCTSARLQME